MSNSKFIKAFYLNTYDGFYDEEKYISVSGIQAVKEIIQPNLKSYSSTGLRKDYVRITHETGTYFIEGNFSDFYDLIQDERNLDEQERTNYLLNLICEKLLLISEILQPEVKSKITEIKKTTTKQENKNNNSQWMNVDDLIMYLPNKPCRNTIYKWKRKGIIPYYKRSKNIYFLRSEIDQWLDEKNHMNN